MSARGEFSKRAADAFIAGVDMATWPMAAGDTAVASNARGALGVQAFSEAGDDVSATIVPDAPWILAGTRVAFWVLAGAAGSRYRIVVTAPTQQGELLTAVAWLRVYP